MQNDRQRCKIEVRKFLMAFWSYGGTTLTGRNDEVMSSKHVFPVKGQTSVAIFKSCCFEILTNFIPYKYTPTPNFNVIKLRSASL